MIWKLLAVIIQYKNLYRTSSLCKHHNWFKSMWHSDVKYRHNYWLTLIQVTVRCLLFAKPLPEPMITYRPLNLGNKLQWNFYISKCNDLSLEMPSAKLWPFSYTSLNVLAVFPNFAMKKPWQLNIWVLWEGNSPRPLIFRLGPLSLTQIMFYNSMDKWLNSL